MAITIEQQGIVGGSAEALAPELLRYRALIRRQRRRRYLGVAAICVGMAWFALGLLGYFNLAPAALTWAAIILTVGLPLGALLYDMWRQPTLAQTAASLDNLLDNKQRMLTSVELMAAGAKRPIEEAQLASSAGVLQAVDSRVLYPARVPWPQLFVAAGLLMLALGLFILKGAGDDNALAAGNLPPNKDTTQAIATPSPESSLPGANQPSGSGQQEGEAGSQMQGLPNPSGTTTTQTMTPQEAQAQADRSREAQKSLQRLARALDEQSATQSAADALRRGEYDKAAGDLTQLGTDNDQLSNQAKNDLADSLDSAAEESAGTPALQQAERDAADALRNGKYEATAQALKDLGIAIQNTSKDAVSQQQLAQSFPEQPNQNGSQGQQGQQGQSDPNGQQGQQGQSGQNGQQGQTGQDGQQGDNSQNQSGQQGQNGQSSQQSQSGTQNGGTPDQMQGEGSRVTGPKAKDLGVEGNPFALEGSEDPSAQRPGTGDDPPAMTLDGNPGGSGSAIAPSSGGPVTANSETNNPPVERWEIVQKYFDGR